jgi:cell division protein FtsB
MAWRIGKMARKKSGAMRVAAVFCLVVMGFLVTIGPSGLLAWQDNAQHLAAYHQEIAALTTARDELRNRVDLLDPNHVDPDLAGELLRSKLNVVRSDEMVMMRPK